MTRWPLDGGQVVEEKAAVLRSQHPATVVGALYGHTERSPQALDVGRRGFSSHSHDRRRRGEPQQPPPAGIDSGDETRIRPDRGLHDLVLTGRTDEARALLRAELARDGAVLARDGAAVPEGQR